MKYHKIPHSNLEVSKICLGTMTFGEQNNEQEAHSQLDLAIERGINFIDTAEMYPVPPNAKSQGLTETYIGNWLKKTGKRDKVCWRLKWRDRGIRRISGLRWLSTVAISMMR